MRICHVIEAAGGGSGQVVIDLVRYCLEAGDEVTVVYSPARARFRFIRSLEALPEVRRVASPMQRKVGWRDAVDAMLLWRLLRHHGPFDVVHSHSSKAGALARLAGFFLRRTVQVYTPHAFITMAPKTPRVFGWIEWLLSWCCDAVITVSPQEEKHALEKLGIARAKVQMIPNGVELNYPSDRNVARREMEFADDRYIIGFVGRLVAQKNPARLVEVFASIAKSFPKARLVVVGGGPLLDITERSLERRGLSDKVKFFTKHDARDLMPGFDCLLCTSDYESYGLIFPEAMVAGVPVVTPPVGIAETAVVQGETGYVTGFEPESLAAAVLRLVSLDQATREQMADKARRHALQFGVVPMAWQTRALYEKLLSGKSAG